MTHRLDTTINFSECYIVFCYAVCTMVLFILGGFGGFVIGRLYIIVTIMIQLWQQTQVLTPFQIIRCFGYFNVDYIQTTVKCD
jgi:hypothetical protein